MIASHHAKFFCFLFFFGGVACCFASSDKTHGPLQVKQHTQLCTVRDVRGSTVQVALTALDGPHIFLVAVRGFSIQFWTLADAQCLLRKIIQRNKIASLQHKLNALCEYVINRQQQPIDLVKYVLVLELFDEFKIAPRLLKNFSEWSIALTVQTYDAVTDPLKLVNQAVDLSVIDARTGSVTPVVIAEDMKQKILKERAAGVSAFPFLYRCKEQKNKRKIPVRSVALASAGAASWFVQVLASVVFVGGGGMAVSKMQKTAPPQRVSTPVPRSRVLDSPPLAAMRVDFSRGPSKAPIKNVRSRSAFRKFRRDYECPKDRMARDLKNDCSAGEKVSLEALDIELLRAFLHRCYRCSCCTSADQTEPQNAPLEGEGEDEDAWIDRRCKVPKMPLFFLKVDRGARAVAVSVKCYKVVREQCSEEELQLLDKKVPVSVVPEAPDSLQSSCAVVSDERVIKLFKIYAPELFEFT